MRTKTVEKTEGVREVHKQPHRFLGLYLAPVAALPFAWLIHVWAFGIQWWVIDIRPGEALRTFTLFALGAAVVVLTIFAYKQAAHRDSATQHAFAATVGLVGALFSWNVGTGPHYVLGGVFVFGSWIAASAWTLPRTNVARKDSRDGAEKDDEDSFLKRMGVSLKTKFSGRVVHDEKTGEPVRIDVKVKHAPGETAEVFAGHTDGIASAVGAPPGFTTAIGDPDSADESALSIPLVDPFKRVIPVGPLSAPGKSIGEWTTVADYANGKVARVTIGNGINTDTPTSYALIGMTRSGKTGTETQLLTDWGSRVDWVCLYLNQAKGMQDARPLLPILEVAQVAEDGGTDLGPYRVAIKQVRENIMNYRQAELSRFAISAWSPRCADPNPDKRPTRLAAHGKRVAMEPMPFFTTHMGEADALFTDHRLSEDVIFVASKGLSLGCNVGLSLQKPDYKSMPTNVRSQIGLWFIHGLAEEGDEEFVMDASVRQAGAHPGRWGARKAGRHYMIGQGVEDESNFAVAARTRFVIDSTRDESGREYLRDELIDRYAAEMLRRNTESANGRMVGGRMVRQAKLDRGSAESTGGWWDEQAALTADLRVRTLGSHARTDDVARPVARDVAGSQPANSQGRANSQPASSHAVPPAFRGKGISQGSHADDDEEEVTPDEIAQAHEEAAEVREVEGIDLYDDPAVEAVDLGQTPDRPVPDYADGSEDDPLFDAEEEAKPAPLSREQAVEALAEALEELLADERLQDPKDSAGDTVIVNPGLVAERYPFKSRPWFSTELAAVSEGRGPLARRFDLALAEDLGVRSGKYRLRRVTESDRPGV